MVALGLERWRQLTDGFSQNAYSVKMRIYRIENSTDAHVTLKRLTSRQDEEMTLLLDFPTKDCEEVMKKLVSLMLHCDRARLVVIAAVLNLWSAAIVACKLNLTFI